MNFAFRHRTTLGLVLLVAALLTSGGAWYYYRSRPVQAATDSGVKTAVARRGDISSSAVGAGTLTQAAQANLGFKSAGRLADLLVEVGDQVEAGAVLARLDDTDARLQVTQAEIALRLAEVRLAQLTGESNASGLASAQAGLAAAQADLARLSTPPTGQEVVAARENLVAAREALDSLLAGPTPEELTIARADLEKAAAALRRAQADYDKVAWRDDIGARPEALALQQATLDYEKARANYDLKMAGPSEEQLAAARAKVAQAESQLEALQRGPDPEALAAAEAKVAQAQAQLDDFLAGASPEDVEVAQLQVDQARTSLQTAQAQLENTVLRAPFAGTVTAVKANAGEIVGATPIIALADLHRPLVQFWLDESERGKLAIGYEAQVTFEALPDEIFTARVVRVDPVLSVVDGVPVVGGLAALDLDEASNPGRFLAGMNAVVEIIAAQRQGSVMVPIEAVRELGPGQYAVFVVGPNGTLTMRPVEVGLTDLTTAEIVSGLEPGEVVSTGVVNTE